MLISKNKMITFPDCLTQSGKLCIMLQLAADSDVIMLDSLIVLQNTEYRYKFLRFSFHKVQVVSFMSSCAVFSTAEVEVRYKLSYAMKNQIGHPEPSTKQNTPSRGYF